MPIRFHVPDPDPVRLAYTDARAPIPGGEVIETGSGQVHRVVSVTDEAIATGDGLIIPAGSVQAAVPAGASVEADLEERAGTGVACRGAPEHLVIEADAAHACPLLGAGGHVFDVLYLDPPYDTGHVLSYADDRDDWADFFHTRLARACRLAHPERGVVIIAIDDRRLAWARLIADAVLGSDGFIACVVWDGGVKGQARLVSTSHDYMLIYAVNPVWMRRNKVQWREPKPGFDTVTAAASRLWDGDPVSSQEKMTAWFKTLGADNPARALSLYRCFDERGRLFREGPVSKPSGGGYVYDVIHPVTGRPVVPPRTGWRYSPARMRRMLAEGRIVFRADHTSSVATRLYLDEQVDQVATSVFTEKRTRAAKRLAAQVGTGQFGAGKFTYPKDTLVLARWLSLVTGRRTDATVLDVFAGSGSITQAVMEMNAADGGRRESVAVTLNEVPGQAARNLLADGYGPGTKQWQAAGLIEQVTRPRLEQVATELGQQVRFARLAVGRGRYLLNDTGHAFRADESGRFAA